MLPIPHGLQSQGPVFAVCGALISAALAWFVWRRMRAGGAIRWVVLAYLAHGGALVAYYGLFFGAPHFLGRYLAPLAPLLVVAVLSASLDLVAWLAGRRADRLAPALAMGGMALSAALLIWLAGPGARAQGHFQVVDWVERHVDDRTWVAAVQTGTLGYWHDRTINLDGKVNPQALAARATQGHVLDYVVRTGKIEVIADWAGMAGWADRAEGGFADAFDLVVEDRAANLAVLRRRDGGE